MFRFHPQGIGPWAVLAGPFCLAIERHKVSLGFEITRGGRTVFVSLPTLLKPLQ